MLDEVRQLNDLGYREVTLLGQTVNAYGHDLDRLPEGQKIDFAWLLEQINAINPKLRVRFTSPHPMYFNTRLIEAIAATECVCEHLHLPMQSGDNDCLGRMKRTYTIEKYRRIVDQMREKIPEVAITTDAIVGFCGETDAEFENTLHAFREIEFDQAYMFAYSPRHSTAAWDWPDDVPAPVKSERLARLIDAQNHISREKNRRHTGVRLEVLVEGVSDKDPARLLGRSRTNKLVLFPGDLHTYPTGSYVEVATREAFLWGFVGEAQALLSPPARTTTMIALTAV